MIAGNGTTAARRYAGVEGPGLLTPDEVDYNDVIEVFREANSYDLQWPDGLADDLKVAKYYKYQVAAAEYARLVAYDNQQINEGLLAGALKSTLDLTLSETESFHYGGPDGIQLGDTISMLIEGQTFTNQVTEAQMDLTRDNGLVISPLIGQHDDDPDVQLAQAVANLSRALRKTLSSK